MTCRSHIMEEIDHQDWIMNGKDQGNYLMKESVQKWRPGRGSRLPEEGGWLESVSNDGGPSEKSPIERVGVVKLFNEGGWLKILSSEGKCWHRLSKDIECLQRLSKGVFCSENRPVENNNWVHCQSELGNWKDCLMKRINQANWINWYNGTSNWDIHPGKESNWTNGIYVWKVCRKE